MSGICESPSGAVSDTVPAQQMCEPLREFPHRGRPPMEIHMLYRLSEDELLERRIMVAPRRLLAASPGDRHELVQRYLELIRKSSPEQVRKMEQERG